MSKRWAFVLPIIALAILVSACGGADVADAGKPDNTTGNTTTPTIVSTPGSLTCVKGSITTNGSTALGPLVQKVAADYQAKCPEANITTSLTGSGAGLTAVAGGNAQVGNSDVFADKTKYPDLVDHQVAVVVFSVVINDEVTGVTSLTTEQIKGIYSGKIVNWKEVGGNDKPIVVISRPPKSGTRLTFEQYILGGTETISGASHLTIDTTGDVAKTLKQTSGAIAYVATNAVASNNLKAISIDSLSNSLENIKNNKYQFWNIEHMYTPKQADPLAQAFIDYMLSPAARTHAESLGFISMSDMEQSALDAKQPKA